ncbi:HtaA domain-containing protein [Cellulomonas sp. HZM]|uniref:HtaA domain-containing protein n=1 Tax=Cellulomonas sp. HZM TaxID=1454010 RepID=UPI000AEB39F4|nr:HtaA domain-containing protein [Cellulomonas sp. HZM]
MRARRIGAALAAAGMALLVAAAPSVGKGVDVQVEIPRSGVLTVKDAELRWGLTREASSGSYAFGCHFLSAGVAGDTGSSRAWTAADGFYRSTSGSVRIQKPDSAGRPTLATWATRCLDRDGKAVTASTTSPSTESEVVVDGGTGTVDQRKGTARIAWRGSFTVAFYGGLTYWSATDPVLTVKGGVGTLTATASGYGADREDASSWQPLEEREVKLATFEHVDLGSTGIVETPDYVGVRVDTGSATPQARRTAANSDYWGAFPQDFVDLQVETGQSAYWYTSGGERDRFKTPLPVYVSYDASQSVAPPTTDPEPGTGDPGGTGDPVTQPTPEPTGTTPGGDGGSGGGGSGGGGSSGGGPTSSTPVTPGLDGGAVAPGVFPATAAATFAAATPGLIPAAGAAVSWLSAQDPLLLGGLGALALLAVVAAIGTWRGWIVPPWTGSRT